MDISQGTSEIVIGLIDGPVDLAHPAFKESKIRTVNEAELVACRNADSISCMHGTFVAGILCANRYSSAPAICPSCTIVLRPIFPEADLGERNEGILLPTSTLKELGTAIVQTIDAGARIINLSVGVSTSSLSTCHDIEQAFNYAVRREAIIVAAAGNQGKIGYDPLFDNYWVIPVVACDTYGRPTSGSNFGLSVGKRGLMAPGVKVKSTSPGGGYVDMSGTSVAAPFVTGTIALVLSTFPKARVEEIMFLIRNGTPESKRSITPPLLNAGDLIEKLKRKY